MLNPNNVSEIKQKLTDLETAVEKFQFAQKLFHDKLCDEDDILESNDYFNTEMERIADLKRKVNEWCERCTFSHDVRPEVRAEDSVSNILV